MDKFNHLKLNSVIAGSGKTQADVAKELGVHHNTISLWVNGGVKAPNPSRLVQILRIAGMNDDDLKEQRIIDWYAG